MEGKPPVQFMITLLARAPLRCSFPRHPRSAVFAMGKRKVDVSSEEEHVDSEEEVAQQKPKKSRAKPKKGAGEPYQDGLGWTIVPPSLIWRDFDSKPNAKVAAFDLDGTLVNTKGALTFPKDADDWKWYNKHTAPKVKQYHEEGYKIVIFSNQGGIKTAVEGKMAEKVKQRIANVVKELGVPAQVFFAPSMAEGDSCRKPATGMWDYFKEHANGGVEPDMEASFFVGDAAGRLSDFDKTDKEFAEAVGLPFKTPEDEFGAMEGKRSLPTMAGAGKAKKGEPAAPATGPNAQLVELFRAAAQAASQASKTPGQEKQAFRAAALTKAARALETFPEQISGTNLKEVNKLAGVGKGSITLIQEYLDTGDIKAAHEGAAPAEGGDAKGGSSAPPTKAQATALNFM